MRFKYVDNKNRKINKTITQAITDKFTKMKAEEKVALLESLKTNGYKTDEEYWTNTNSIRQFILGEVKDSGEYTKEEIGHVERSLREAREAGHGDTANSDGGEEEHGAATSEGGEEEHDNTVNSEGGEEGHGNTVSERGEEEHGNTVNSEGGEERHGYSVSESNVINLLKSMKGYLNGDGMNDEQLRLRLQNVREKYERTY